MAGTMKPILTVIFVGFLFLGFAYHYRQTHMPKEVLYVYKNTTYSGSWVNGTWVGDCMPSNVRSQLYDELSLMSDRLQSDADPQYEAEFRESLSKYHVPVAPRNDPEWVSSFRSYLRANGFHYRYIFYFSPCMSFSNPFLRPDQVLESRGGECWDFAGFYAEILLAYGETPTVVFYSLNSTTGHAWVVWKNVVFDDEYVFYCPSDPIKSHMEWQKKHGVYLTGARVYYFTVYPDGRVVMRKDGRLG